MHIPHSKDRFFTERAVVSNFLPLNLAIYPTVNCTLHIMAAQVHPKGQNLRRDTVESKVQLCYFVLLN